MPSGLPAGKLHRTRARANFQLAISQKGPDTTLLRNTVPESTTDPFFSRNSSNDTMYVDVPAPAASCRHQSNLQPASTYCNLAECGLTVHVSSDLGVHAA